MLIGNKNFDLENSAYVCGILNVTPDSFSDGGCYNNIDAALFHTDRKSTRLNSSHNNQSRMPSSA